MERQTKLVLASAGILSAGAIAYLATKKRAETEYDPIAVEMPAPLKKKPLLNLFPKAKPQTETKPLMRVKPEAMADSLHVQIRKGHLPNVLALLRQFKTTAEYALVNEKYQVKKAAKLDFSSAGKLVNSLVSKTLVTDLLDVFKEAKAREAIIVQLRRIGLKHNPSTNKWSLSGFGQVRNLLTIAETFVEDIYSNRIRSKKNTLLGEEHHAANGRTYFKALDNMIYSVPSRDVRRV